MENDIAMITTAYLLARLAVLAAFGYLVYRILRPRPMKARVKSQSFYAIERLQGARRYR